MTPATWSATCPTVFLANTLGFARASSTVSGSSGHEGVSAAYPASSKTVAQRSQLLGSDQRPWMKTAAGRPEAFASSICSVSRSVIFATRTTSHRFSESVSTAAISKLGPAPGEHIRNWAALKLGALAGGEHAQASHMQNL